MLRSLNDLESYKVHAVDGEIGRVTDFLFDDQHWTTRYLVTDTSDDWHESNQVLISPISFQNADWSTRLFNLTLTRDKVRHSPSVDLDKPVSRQYERDYSQYYGWPYYWGELATSGFAEYATAPAQSAASQEQRLHEQETADPHLRSAKEVAGYHIRGSDGEIGHIADFIVDDETWAVRYLVIDTSNWWFGKKVLVAPRWAQKISWARSMVYVNLSKDAIRHSPEWNPDALINREYEERLYEHYGRPTYWSCNDPTAKPGVTQPETKYLPRN